MYMEIALKSHLFQMRAVLRCPNTLSRRDTGSNRINLLKSEWFKVTPERFSSMILRRCNRQTQLSESILRHTEPKPGRRAVREPRGTWERGRACCWWIRTASPGRWYLVHMVTSALSPQASPVSASDTLPGLV